jgi:hypothetical protein
MTGIDFYLKGSFSLFLFSDLGLELVTQSCKNANGVGFVAD